RLVAQRVPSRSDRARSDRLNRHEMIARGGVEVCGAERALERVGDRGFPSAPRSATDCLADRATEAEPRRRRLRRGATWRVTINHKTTEKWPIPRRPSLARLQHVGVRPRVRTAPADPS